MMHTLRTVSIFFVLGGLESAHLSDLHIGLGKIGRRAVDTA